jgi:hypothetical protein
MLSSSNQNDEKRQGPVQPWPSHGPTSFPCYYTSNGFVLHYTNVLIAHWFSFIQPFTHLKPITMLSTTSFDKLKEIPYGVNLRGDYKSYKVRYALAVAEVFISHIPEGFQKSVMKYVTQKGYVFLGIVDHRNSMIWHYINNAKEIAFKKKAEGIGQLKLKM